MAEKKADEPSLELPSLFRRKRGEQTTVVADPVLTEPAAVDTAEPTEVIHPVREPVEEPAVVQPAAEPVAARVRTPLRERELPALAASTAVLVVGALVGLVGCILTYLSLKGCELVTGTDSCGGPGLLVLGAILVAMVLLGAALLRGFRVADAGTLSFLGVGLMTVVLLLFLLDYLYAPWMLAVIPALTALSFAVARWVTTRYADEVMVDDGPERHDIR